jgi:hypothetical protein
MIILSSDIEKELWRAAVLKSLGNVDDVTAEQHQDAIKFACIVADGIIISYRKRCKEDERTQK